MGIGDRFLPPFLAACYCSALVIIPYLAGQRIGYYLKDKYRSYKISQIVLTEQDYIDNHKKYGKRKITETRE